MRNSIKALIFDADGTLVDSEELGLDVLHELANAEGARLTREDCNRYFRGIRMALVSQKVASLVPDCRADFVDTFTQRVRAVTAQRMAQGLNALPGAHALLQNLRIPFCVATNGPQEKVQMTMRLSGLLPFVAGRIYTAYEVGSFKPDPGLFLHAAAELGVTASHCGVVEDSIAGIQAGLAAGMRVFSLHPEEGLPPEYAEKVTFIRDLSALTQHL